MRHTWRFAFLISAVVFGACQREAPLPRASTRSEQLRPKLPLSSVDKATETVGESINHRLEIAQSHFERGQFAEALTLLKPALLARPDDFQTTFLLARCQAEMGNLALAIETLDQFKSEDLPTELGILGQSADWLVRLEQYDKAIARLQRIVQIAPNLALAHRRLAHLLDHLGRSYEAAPHLMALVNSGVATEDELDAIANLSEPHLHPSNPGQTDEMIEIPVAPLFEAQRFWAIGEQREAATLIQRIGQQTPSSIATAAFALKVFSRMSLHDAFAETLSQLPEGIETSADYWDALAYFHQSQGEHAIAIRCFLETVHRDPTNRYAYLSLARSLQTTKFSVAAATALERYRLLDRVAFLMTELKRPPEVYLEIIQSLRLLQRPCEAVGWEKVAATSDSDASAGSCEEPSPSERDEFVQCGLSLLDWPLPAGSAKLAIKDGSDLHLATKSGERSVASNPLKLRNVARSTGLNFQYRPGPVNDDDRLAMHETVGGGIAAVDFDLDGWTDLYLVQSGGIPNQREGSGPNQLFRNLDGETWINVSDSAGCDDRGYGQGASTADLNQDGFPELIVANFGMNIVFVNNGDGTFTPATLVSGPSGIPNLSIENQWTTSIACGDLTGDNLPDLIEVNYIDDVSVLTSKCTGTTPRPQCNPQRYRAATDRFLQNLGNGNWKSLDVAHPARQDGYGFAAVIANFDRQAGNDLFISNDTNFNHYWLSRTSSDGPNRFELVESAELYGCAFGVQGMAQSCMGIATGDFDRNGRLDLHVTNYTQESSDLMMQSDTGMFSNLAVAYGLDRETRPVIGWGTQSPDLDNDGWLDLVILNGHLYHQASDGSPYRMAPQCFHARPGQFEIVSSQILQDEFWSTPTLGRALAQIDWNRDGRIDLVAGHLDAPLALLENESEGGHWIQFELIGTSSERDAIGAEVMVTTDGDSESERIIAWKTGGDGFLSKNEPVLTIGLGKNGAGRNVEVQWPAGTMTRLTNVSVDQRYLLIEPIASTTHASLENPEIFLRKSP